MPRSTTVWFSAVPHKRQLGFKEISDAYESEGLICELIYRLHRKFDRTGTKS